MKTNMTFVSLFAGIGGFDLGLERAGHKCLGQVEINKHAKEVLTKQWKDVPKHGDVKTAKGWADEIGLVGKVDIVCGGFPDGWTDGQSDTQRYKQIGNAVTVNVIEWIGKRL